MNPGSFFSTPHPAQNLLVARGLPIQRRLRPRRHRQAVRSAEFVKGNEHNLHFPLLLDLTNERAQRPKLALAMPSEEEKEAKPPTGAVRRGSDVNIMCVAHTLFVRCAV